MPETLLDAVIKGDVASVDKFVEFGMDINEPDQYNRTYMHWAAQGGNSSMVKKLISLSADCTVRTNFDKYALLWASAHGSLDVVRALVEKAGADNNFANKNNQRAVDIARMHKHNSIVKYLNKLDGLQVSDDSEDDVALANLAKRKSGGDYADKPGSKLVGDAPTTTKKKKKADNNTTDPHGDETQKDAKGKSKDRDRSEPKEKKSRGKTNHDANHQAKARNRDDVAPDGKKVKPHKRRPEEADGDERERPHKKTHTEVDSMFDQSGGLASLTFKIPKKQG